MSDPITLQYEQIIILSACWAISLVLTGLVVSTRQVNKDFRYFDQQQNELHSTYRQILIDNQERAFNKGFDTAKAVQVIKESMSIDKRSLN